MALAFDEYGSGEPLVVIHGLGTNRGIWSDVALLLGRERKLVAIDLPGFGESPPAGSGFDLAEVADVVADSIEGRVGRRYDLLGHSLGGAVALTVAARRPETLRRLILHAPAGFRPRSGPIAEAASGAVPLLLRARRLAGRPLMDSATARRALLWGAVHDGSRVNPSRARAMLDASRSARRLREAARAAIAADLIDDLADCDCAIGLLWGENDPLMPRQTQEAIRRCRPEAPVEVVPEAGHVAQVEQPRAFAEAVERLLRRITDGSLGTR